VVPSIKKRKKRKKWLMPLNPCSIVIHKINSTAKLCGSINKKKEKKEKNDNLWLMSFKPCSIVIHKINSALQTKKKQNKQHRDNLNQTVRGKEL
jgi:hypothetical protein